tara:strand:+ start:871 stop:1095 length:225 start_codon:yes stop_codon:yes gene_type:complete
MDNYVYAERIDYNICEDLISPHKGYHLRISEADFILCKKIQDSHKNNFEVEKKDIDAVRNLYVTLNNSEIKERK